MQKLMLPYKNVLSKVMVLTLVGSLAPSLVYAGAETPVATEALYDSRAELESANANLEDAESAHDASIEEFQLAKENHAEMTTKNNNTAASIRKEIARLQKEQANNIKTAKNLSNKAADLSRQIQKNEAAEKRAQEAAEVAAQKLDKVRTEFEQTRDRRELSVQAMKEVKANQARAQRDLANKQRELVAAKKAEQRTEQALRTAENQLKNYQARYTQEMRKLDKQLQASLSKASQNERRADSMRFKKQQMESSLKDKRQRLGDARARERRSFARVSSN